MSTTIWFNTYIHNGYELLSNFYMSPFELDGVKYRTNEHFYQSSKFANSDPTYAKVVNASKTPGGAKQLASETAHPIDPDWEKIKLDVMMKGLRAKFADKKRRAVLIGTGDAILVESSYKDQFWGKHPISGGANNLGILLMKLRDEIKNE